MTLLLKRDGERQARQAQAQDRQQAQGGIQAQEAQEEGHQASRGERRATEEWRRGAGAGRHDPSAASTRRAPEETRARRDRESGVQDVQRAHRGAQPVPRQSHGAPRRASRLGCW